MIKAFLNWLKPPTSARIGMRPHRNVELECDFDAAYDRVLEALDKTLGANISFEDRTGQTIEAGFGLLKSERIRVTFEELDRARTKVRIEAFYPAGAAIAAKSAAVEALANELAKNAES